MNKEIIVTPLGTVSTYCSEDKCCPGFLVEYGDIKIMLDCGNGISKYLNLPNDFNNLSIIISHLHSDHYGDLLSLSQTSLVYSRLGYINERIKVYIPDGDKTLIDYNYLVSLEKESFLKFIPYNGNDILNYDDLRVSFSRNPHPITTYSIKLENEGISLVYSSDTGYKNNTLNSFAKDADLLICESTFLKGQVRKEDYHLYASEAGKIARTAKVKKLLLTHFWPSINIELYI